MELHKFVEIEINANIGKYYTTGNPILKERLFAGPTYDTDNGSKIETALVLQL